MQDRETVLTRYGYHYPSMVIWLEVSVSVIIPRMYTLANVIFSQDCLPDLYILGEKYILPMLGRKKERQEQIYELHTTMHPSCSEKWLSGSEHIES